MNERPGRVPAKYRQIADHFRAEITAGRLRPGDQLPSQKSIEDDFGVVTGTVVHALDELRRAGLVETRHGAGTFVLEPAPAGEPAPDEIVKRLDAVEADIMELYARLGYEHRGQRERGEGKARHEQAG